jgi:hypothetical protein
LSAEPTGTPNEGGIDFAAFVLSLSSAAMQHLGQGGPDSEANLQLAKQTIDILAMLQDKTSGNLSEQEDKLLGHILYDLRMRFVEASRGKGD